MRCTFLVYPETHLVRELLVVKASGKHGFFYQFKLNCFSPFVGFEIALYLVRTHIWIEPRIDELVALVWLHQDLRDTDIKLLILYFVQTNIDLILQCTLEI